tara:strand:+ start:179 stop:427 length:249 start_codon:yes stop_codon:yes gene_type:complete
MDVVKRIEKELGTATEHGLGFDDWISMKKYLLRSIPSHMRTNFSTRDPKTKAQHMNEFEVGIVKSYEALTGKSLRLPHVTIK